MAARLGLITTQHATSLKLSVGMRNVLTHEYANVDIARVAAAIPTARDEYGAYVRAVAHWLANL